MHIYIYIYIYIYTYIHYINYIYKVSGSTREPSQNSSRRVLFFKDSSALLNI